MITAISAYVPIPDHPRSEQEFDALGQQLLGLEHRMLLVKGDLDKCWLYQYLVGTFPPEHVITHSISDNPKKNSLAYHIVQAQKTEWLEVVAYVDPVSDVFVWIDYGIMHVPGVTVEIIDAFLDRADSEQAIAIPGCWTRNYRYDDEHPCWRFCGGVMVVPRKFVGPLNEAMKAEYMDWIRKTNNISWEVNALARLENNDPEFPVWWYGPCDHNATMFTMYKRTEDAE
jgi:hypothetical protein